MSSALNGRSWCAPRAGGKRYAGAVSNDRERPVFLFFSNKLGCLGSILVSLAVTLLLLLAFGWL